MTACEAPGPGHARPSHHRHRAGRLPLDLAFRSARPRALRHPAIRVRRSRQAARALGLTDAVQPSVAAAAEALGEAAPAASRGLQHRGRRLVPATRSSWPDRRARRSSADRPAAGARGRPGSAQSGATILVEEAPALAGDAAALSRRRRYRVPRVHQCRRSAAGPVTAMLSLAAPASHFGLAAGARLRRPTPPQQLSTAEPQACTAAPPPIAPARDRAAAGQPGRLRDLRPLHGASRGRLRRARLAFDNYDQAMQLLDTSRRPSSA